MHKYLLGLLLVGLSACHTIKTPHETTEACKESHTSRVYPIYKMLTMLIPIEETIYLVEDYSGTMKFYGYTSYSDKGYVITLNSLYCYDVQLKILMHEYAHIMVWDAQNESDHDALWGVAYARVYRTIVAD